MKFGTGYFAKSGLSVSFVKNRPEDRQAYTLLEVINEFLHMLFTFIHPIWA